MTEEMNLPQDGPARIGSVALPAGQRIYGWDEYSGNIEGPAAWVTSGPMADAGHAWLALSDAQPVTGLVPVLLSRADNYARLGTVPPVPFLGEVMQDSVCLSVKGKPSGQYGSQGVDRNSEIRHVVVPFKSSVNG